MAAFLLIHGACHGAWCWQEVLPRLTRLGHQARAIDLPGRGTDPRPHADLTLPAYAQAVADALEGPTILVGHSAGGMAISAAAELAPERVQRLVYLCAFLPGDGQSLADLANSWPAPPLKGIARTSPDRHSYALHEQADDTRFYHDVPVGLRHWARARLCAEPMAPHAQPIRLGANWRRCPRSYIRCTEDLTIAPEHQAQMARAVPEEERYDMPTGHSPFLSAPDALAALLHRIAEAG